MYPKSALHIYATNKQLQVHNEKMLNEISRSNKVPIITLSAVDMCRQTSTQKLFKRKEALLTEKSCLPTSLSVCIGARVMLCLNIDVEDGLTNGAMGTVTAIVDGTKPLGLPVAIFVLFDDERTGASVRRSSTVPA